MKKQVRLLEELRLVVGANNVLQDGEAHYASMDQSTNVRACLPLAVVRVKSIDELIRAAKICINLKNPLVIRAAGTGKSGGAVPQATWVVIDISALNKIIHIDKDNLSAEVEPGVILGEFQARVREHGLFYPPDPASYEKCTIGGNVAENAGGPSTLKYGCTKEYVLGGQALLGTGEVINFGKACPKGVAGYDIASILCGSEGTLAVFTKLTLRLLPLPKDEAQSLFLFKSEEEALMCVKQIFGCGHRPKILEYIDHVCIKALQKAGHMKFVPESAKAALLIECDASFAGGGRMQIAALKESLKLPLVGVIDAQSLEGPYDFRQIRASLSEACHKYLGKKISEDIAVPISRLAALRNWFMAQRKNSLVCALFGHAGDGNLHVQILFAEEKEREQAQILRHELLLKVLALGGTISAEHGIGLQKVSYLVLEQSVELINLQKRIKHAFDPHNLLNPGKIFAK
jgi:glycolate oxidase